MSQLSQDFSKYSVAFCESMQALELAWDNGLPKNCKILYRSPAMEEYGLPNGENLDNRVAIRKTTYDEMYSGLNNRIEHIFHTIEQEYGHNIGILVGRHCHGWFRNILMASFLDEEDLTQERLLIEPIVSKFTDPTYYTPPEWGRYLSLNPLVEVWKPALEIDHPETRASLRSRISVMGTRHYLWRLVQKFYDLVPLSLRQTTVYYVSETELSRDIGLEFAKRGHRVERLALLQRDTLCVTESDRDMAGSIVEVIRSHAQTGIENLVPEKLWPVLFTILRDELALEIRLYLQSKMDLARYKDKLSGGKGLIISNCPLGGSAIALGELCREWGSIYAAFQHGMTREFLGNPQNTILYEHTVATHFISLTEVAQEISRAVKPYTSNAYKGMSAGLPRDFFKLKGGQATGKAVLPILFVGTLYNRGYCFNGSCYISDKSSYNQEVDLLRTVEAAVSGKVVYKPYPAIRYCDQDSLTRYSSTAKNSGRGNVWWDLRFIVRNYRMLVVQGATSTISWCFMAGCPVVFINPVAPLYRLKAELVDSFSKSFFYFDLASPTGLKELGKFLTKHENNLEKEWEKKKVDREAFAKRFLSPGDAKGSYRYLLDELNAAAEMTN